MAVSTTATFTHGATNGRTIRLQSPGFEHGKTSSFHPILTTITVCTKWKQFGQLANQRVMSRHPAFRSTGPFESSAIPMSLLVLPECLHQLDVASENLLRLQALHSPFDTVCWVSTGCDIRKATPWCARYSRMAPHVIPPVEIRRAHFDQAVIVLPI